MKLDDGVAERRALPPSIDRGGTTKGNVVRSLKTSERVAMDVVRDIVDQELRPGDKLPGEAAMLNRYAASRASVREALRLLEVQGLITLKPGPRGGPTVGTVDPRHLARTGTLY